MEKIMWLVCGVTTFLAALPAGRNVRAVYLGRWTLGVLYLVFGAAVNLIYRLTGVTYQGFADGSPFPFVRQTWRDVVAPHQAFWITLLIVFEASVGLLVLSGGRRSQVGLVAIMGFTAALISFSWFFVVWSVRMLAALVLLLRAERHHGAPPFGWPGRAFVATPQAALGSRS